MNETAKETKNFIGYEYTDVTVKRELEPLYSDNYPSFGWILEGRNLSTNRVFSTSLKFKRDRRIRNKAELTRLQRQFESGVGEIEKLQNSITTAASAAAYGIGIVGTAFMAGAVFSVLAEMIPLCVVLAIPAFAGWVIPYFCYNQIKSKKTAQATPLIDGQYDTICEICEKASALIN